MIPEIKHIFLKDLMKNKLFKQVSVQLFVNTTDLKVCTEHYNTFLFTENLGKYKNVDKGVVGSFSFFLIFSPGAEVRSQGLSALPPSKILNPMDLLQKYTTGT